MAATYMNYHHIQKVSLKMKENHAFEHDGTEYGVLELELIDRDGNYHTIMMFHDEPFTDEQLDEPTL